MLLLGPSKALDRIQFVKMFKCLIERDICPSIARLIAAIFINQQIRVKCGNHFFPNLLSPATVLNKVECYHQYYLRCK